MALRQRKTSTKTITPNTVSSPSSFPFATSQRLAHEQQRNGLLVHDETESILKMVQDSPSKSVSEAECLRDDNRRLRQELHDLKKLLNQYEQNNNKNRRGWFGQPTTSTQPTRITPTNSHTHKNTHLISATDETLSYPPPPLPSLEQQKYRELESRECSTPTRTTGKKTSIGITADTNTRRRSLLANENDSPLVGLHHRAVTMKDAATAVAADGVIRPILRTKLRDSMEMTPDHDDDDKDIHDAELDIESPRPTTERQVLLKANYSHESDGDDDDENYDLIHEQFHRQGMDDSVPCITFGNMIMDRAGWLVGLLVLQSMSSFIIQHNEVMLQKHLVIVRFLTMLVGAGGNAGNQASVRVIRGLAIGSIQGKSVWPFLMTEFAAGLCLSITLSVAGCIRAAVFSTPMFETVAITTSLFMIVLISVVLGATLPLGMKLVGIDPAHSSTTIQVLMDILGVLITVSVSSLILDSPLAHWLGVKH